MYNTDERFKVKLKAVNEHKIYWISITKYCNNNCLFCLDKDNRRSFFVDLKIINKQLNLAHKQGYTKLILSGGEPTLHPDLIKILGLAKKNHFRNIQIISNGRMFADKKFAASCMKGGINEFTLSLHSHDVRVQDRLMGGQGFGSQSQQGLSSLIKMSKILKVPIIINIDIVLNKYNIRTLPETILYYSKNFQVYEFDLLFPIPFGQALPNKKDIFFDIKENFSSLKKVFDLYRKDKRYYIWLNRFPAQYLRNFEDLIQDPLKILNELSGNKENIDKLIRKGNSFTCKNKARCKLCHLQNICNLMHEYYLNFSKKKDLKGNIEPQLNRVIYLSELLRKKHYLPLNRGHWQIKLDDLKNFSDNETAIKIISKKIGQLKKINNKNFEFFDLPRCLLDKNAWIKNSSVWDIYPSKNFNIFTDYFLNRLNKIKALECDKCKLKNQCQGIHINIVRKAGFKILKPILGK